MLNRKPLSRLVNDSSWLVEVSSSFLQMSSAVQKAMISTTNPKNQMPRSVEANACTEESMPERVR